jgi:type IV pilus secretin PilQ/predicted competence protein
MKPGFALKTRLNPVLAVVALVAGSDLLVAQDIPPTTDPSLDPGAVSGGDVSPAADSGAPSNMLQERTTIIYRDAPLLDVINHLTEATKINAAMAPAAVAMGKENVTIRLTDVTYETALKTVLDLYRLGTVLENGVLRIDTLENIKREQEDKKRTRDSRMILEPTRLMVWQLNHAKSDAIAPVIANTLASIKSIDQRFSIQPDTRSNKLLVEGTQEAQMRVKTLIENLDRGKPGVTIEARIIEATNNVAQTLRVNWGTRFGMDAARGMSTGLPFPNSILGSMAGAGATAPVGVGRNDPSPSSVGLSLGSINGMIQLDAILQAYEQEDLAHIIASPSVTVMDNETAHFEETMETRQLSVPIGNGQSAAGASFQAKLSLDVKPLIASDNTLELEVSVDRDSPTSAADAAIQSKTARNAKTKLTVRNGETAVIGGLYQTKKVKTQGRVPVLGRLPIIGFLFRSTQETTERAEIMILITPRIVPAAGGTTASAPPISNLSGFPAPAAATPANPAMPGNLAVPTQTSATAPTNLTLPPNGTGTNANGAKGSADELSLDGEEGFGANSMNSINPSTSLNQGTIPTNNSAKKNNTRLNSGAANNGLNTAAPRNNTVANSATSNGAGNGANETLGTTNSTNSGTTSSTNSGSTNSIESTDSMPELDNLDEDL